MTRTIILLATIFSLAHAKAQTTELPKQYFDQDWKPLAGPQGAARYRTVDDKGVVTIARDYYMSGNIEEVSEWRYVKGKLMRYGKAVVYYENGTVKHEGDYREDELYGVHRYYYADGKPQMVTRTDEKETTYYRHFWTPAGTDLLANGRGTIPVKSSRDERTFHIIADSVIDATFTDNLNTHDTIFTVVPKPAEYKGGLPAMSKDVAKTLRYPADARRRGKEGSVFISMVIGKDGKLSDMHILKGFDPECDTEALRTVTLLDNWNAATYKGKPVSSRFVLPLKFKLSSGRRR